MTVEPRCSRPQSTAREHARSEHGKQRGQAAWQEIAAAVHASHMQRHASVPHASKNMRPCNCRQQHATAAWKQCVDVLVMGGAMQQLGCPQAALQAALCACVTAAEHGLPEQLQLLLLHQAVSYGAAARTADVMGGVHVTAGAMCMHPHSFIFKFPPSLAFPKPAAYIAGALSVHPVFRPSSPSSCPSLPLSLPLLPHSSQWTYAHNPPPPIACLLHPSLSPLLPLRACCSCGSMSHKVADCLERPRAKGARWTNKHIAADDKVQQIHLTSYDSKRDR